MFCFSSPLLISAPLVLCCLACKKSLLRPLDFHITRDLIDWKQGCQECMWFCYAVEITSEFDFYQEIIYLNIHITTGSPHHWSYLMIFLSEKRFPYFDKIHNYSSIYNKLSFDVTTISLVLTLSYFSLLDIVLFCFDNRPCRLWFVSKESFETKQLL